MRATSASCSTALPSRIFHVSGLWQYRHRKGQPFMKTVRRVPGPSTAVTSSHECTEPTSPTRMRASSSLLRLRSTAPSPAVPAPARRPEGNSRGTSTTAVGHVAAVVVMVLDRSVEGAREHVELLLAREAHEVHGVARDPDGQLRVLLGVLHGVQERLTVEHVDVHVEALG